MVCVQGRTYHTDEDEEGMGKEIEVHMRIRTSTSPPSGSVSTYPQRSPYFRQSCPLMSVRYFYTRSEEQVHARAYTARGTVSTEVDAYRPFITSWVAAHLRLVQVADEGEWGGSRDAKPLEVLVGTVGKAATAEFKYGVWHENEEKERIRAQRETILEHRYSIQGMSDL